MTNTVETYKNEEGKIAVLVSPGYGAGWSTWYGNKQIAWDKRILDYIFEHGDIDSFISQILTEANQKLFTNFLNSIGYPYVYLGGAADLIIQWIEPETYFRITENDGSEHLEILDIDNQYVKLS